MSSRSTTLGLAVASSLWLATGTAKAAPIVLEGDVPNSGLDHFFIEFDVPAGIKEIHIHHDDLSKDNILDWGLDDPAGYRGWGGGTDEDTIVGEKSASRAYVPGPITPGKWRVVVGKAKIVASPAKYHVEIDLRTEATLAPIPRQKYVPAAARKTETRYYAGDFHVHDIESTDAHATISDNIALAKSRGLDFIELSDHNTVTQLDFFNELQAAQPDFLLLPGIEFTTYKGHANAIGATKWIDHRIGQPGATINAAGEAARAQGAILSINHPVLDIGNQCIGCAWKQDIDPTLLGGVEIETIGYLAGGRVFSEAAIKFWDTLLDKGVHLAAIGGSDDHKAGVAEGSLFPSLVGSPTTLVRATELSAAGIVAGVKKGATVVKLDGPDDPMVELEAAPAKGAEPIGFPGDTVGARAIVLRAKVTRGAGDRLRLVQNGVPLDAVDVEGDPFVYETIVPAPAQGEERWRAEAMVDDKPRTVTSHIWVKNDPAGPLAEEAKPADDGCGVAREGSTGASILTAIAIAFVGAAGLRRRQRAR